MRGAVATAALLAAPSYLRQALAALPPTLPALPSGTNLQAPNFTALAPQRRHKAGIRPHRIGGVKLELEKEPVDTPNGRKFFIHNYGHSGAGITLSWGCASHVVDHVQTVMSKLTGTNTRPSVAVLGIGIIGLTVATELRRKWPRLPITVYAKNLDVSTTTSFIAGGQFEPSQIYRQYLSDNRKEILADYLRRSARRIDGLQNSGRHEDFGIALRRNYTFYTSTAFEDFTPEDVVGPPTRMRLPFGNADMMGYEYITWLMNPMILMPTLKEELKNGGVLFKTKTFGNRREIENELKESIVVNCTGYGAKKLFGDPSLRPRRGHLVVLPNPGNLKYFVGGGCNNATFYMFARQGDIVIGGTVNDDDDEERDFFDDADASDRRAVDRIFENARSWFAGQAASCVDPLE